MPIAVYFPQSLVLTARSGHLIEFSQVKVNVATADVLHSQPEGLRSVWFKVRLSCGQVRFRSSRVVGKFRIRVDIVGYETSGGKEIFLLQSPQKASEHLKLL